MLLSAFSHYALFHLSINMYVLWSFAPPITLVLGKEQFVAFYLSTGKNRVINLDGIHCSI